MQIIIQRMDKQQGPTVEHRELYSISYDKPWQKKNIKKNVCVCVYVCIWDNEWMV